MNHQLNEHISFARRLVRVLDLRFNVFGVKFGIDPLLDIIPGFGNGIAAATSCYMFWIAWKLHVPKEVYWKMAGNILLDYIFGVIPLAGVVFDMFYRSNVKNFALLEKFFDPSIIEGEILDA